MTTGHPRSTLNDTPCPYQTLFRSESGHRRPRALRNRPAPGPTRAPAWPPGYRSSAAPRRLLLLPGGIARFGVVEAARIENPPGVFQQPVGGLEHRPRREGKLYSRPRVVVLPGPRTALLPPLGAPLACPHPGLHPEGDPAA